VIVAADELAPGGMAAPAPLRRYAAVWGAAPVPDLAEAGAALAAALAERRPSGAGQPLAVRAAATVLAYARATQPGGTLPIARLACYEPGATMVLDEAAIANLELCQTLVGAAATARCSTCSTTPRPRRARGCCAAGCYIR
jgi:hypothetical protein